MTQSNITAPDFADLPVGTEPTAIELPHFPDPLHAVVWRNWDLVDVGVLAKVLGATTDEIVEIAQSMGLPGQRLISQKESRLNYMTIIRRNWHLLPYRQLCQVLDWGPAKMQFALNEDDFMWVKLGGYKPRCAPVTYRPKTRAFQDQTNRISNLVRVHFGDSINAPAEPLFGFTKKFAQPGRSAAAKTDSIFNIRMCYPYFLRFGDPLIGEGISDIPDGYLSQLADCGINAIWFHGVLNTLAPWSLAPELSQGWEERLENLNQLVERCRKHGIEVLMYLNEPRAMPRTFFEKNPDLRGVDETPERLTTMPNVVALCTSTPAVQEFLINSVRHVLERVPNLGGIFSITYSENLTNCYSRNYRQHACPRCRPRGPEVVNAEVLTLIERGMRLAGSRGKVLWYVWSCPQDWVPGIIEKLPKSIGVLCISEWGTPFIRGDYSGVVNEYSISVIGPSDQSRRNWESARRQGLKAFAKIQAGTSTEMFLLPHLPATRRVAQHVSNLVDAGVSGLMLGWSLGGWPSTNMEIATELGHSPRPNIDEAMLAVAKRRFGEPSAKAVVVAWGLLSDAYGEFPFEMCTVYKGPQCLGPANLLFAKPSGYAATMVTFPYDDLDGWRGPYSPETFQRQFEKLAERWQNGVAILDGLRRTHPSVAIEDEWRVAEAAGICFRSAANQVRFIRIRETDWTAAKEILHREIGLARKLFDLVCRDSRIGFEATVQYGFTRFDLVEKILNCEHLLQLDQTPKGKTS